MDESAVIIWACLTVPTAIKYVGKWQGTARAKLDLRHEEIFVWAVTF